MSRPDAARRAALTLLAGVREHRRMLSDMAGPDGPLAGLDPAARARAGRLARETLRRSGRADAFLAAFLTRRPPGRIADILRLATVEMHALGAAPHGVVSDAVARSRRLGGGAAHAGLVNAVLRKVAARPTAEWAALGPQRLPGWLRGRLDAAWGRTATAAIEAAHEAGAATDLTPRGGDAAGLAAAVGGRVLPTGSVRLAAGGRLSALPGHAEGAWWIQDAAAALPARALAPKPGERVLDLCAAPGGKTLQLAAAGAEVTALDAAPARMARLAENLARTGLSARTVTADAQDWRAEAAFDAVLLDAPCSATGTIRRHPELPFIRDARGLRGLVAAQDRLLDRAVAALAPGGRLVFCTCSLLPAEGEDRLAALLARHPGLACDAAALALPGVEEDWRAPGGGLRLRPDHWPGHGGLDGFFIAALRKAP